MKALLLTLVVGVIAATGGCTLLLPTDELIKPCTVDEDCKDPGFECKENACLPLDDGEGE